MSTAGRDAQSGEHLGRWAGLTLLAAMLAAPPGAVLAVTLARAAVVARDGDPGDGIGYAIPALLGAGGAALLVLAAAAGWLRVRRDRASRVRAARGIVVLPVLAALPVSVVLLSAALLGQSTSWPATAALALLPLAVTGGAAGAVRRSARLGVRVLAALLIGGVVVVAVLGLDAVILLLPHLVVTLGCWAVALGLLVPVRGRTVRAAAPRGR